MQCLKAERTCRPVKSKSVSSWLKQDRNDVLRERERGMKCQPGKEVGWPNRRQEMEGHSIELLK